MFLASWRDDPATSHGHVLRTCPRSRLGLWTVVLFFNVVAAFAA